MKSVPKAPTPGQAPTPAHDQITMLDLREVEDYLAGARSALDDLWFTAADASARDPVLTRATHRLDVHRHGYAVLQLLRAAETELDRCRRKLIAARDK